MSFAASDHQIASLPPRHFWRRAIAYGVDMIIFRIVFALLFFVLSTVTPWDMTLPLLTSQRCDVTTTGPLIAKIEAEWPLQPGETRTNLLCHISWLGSNGYYVFRSQVVKQQGATTSARAVTISVNEKVEPVTSVIAVNPAGDIVLLILPFVFAYCSTGGRRTLGKQLMSLRIRTVDNDAVTFGMATKREALKFMPLTLLAIVNLVNLLQSVPPDMVDKLIQQARDPNLFTTSGILALTGALMPTLFVFALIWWLFPLIIWRGQTFYDRLCDTKVVKD